MKLPFTNETPRASEPSAAELRSHLHQAREARARAAVAVVEAQQRFIAAEAGAGAAIGRGEDPAAAVLEATTAAAAAKIRATAAERNIEEAEIALAAAEDREKEAAATALVAELHAKVRGLFNQLLAAADINDQLIALGGRAVELGVLRRVTFAFKDVREEAKIWIRNCGIAPPDMLALVSRQPPPRPVPSSIAMCNYGGDIISVSIKEARRRLKDRTAELAIESDRGFLEDDAA